MHDLDRIDHALESRRLDPALFERCAQDLLTEVYPGLSAIPGGTDWGRDGDVSDNSGETPVRLLVTTSRTLNGVKANMLGGIRSMKEHGVRCKRVVLANPAVLSNLDREKLKRSAKKLQVKVEAVYGREFFASKLRRDGEWRTRLLNLPGHTITVSRLPSDLAESPWVELPLVGRAEELEALSCATSDVVVKGVPGVGKTRLISAVDGALFIDKDAPIDRVLDDLRWLQPKVLVVDDASDSDKLIRRLIRFRQVESDVAAFRLIVSCWPDETDKVMDCFAAIQHPQVIEASPVEREVLDKLLLSMGITRYIARSEILDQAEGRPGWAVSLGSLLLHGDAETLLSGKGILGQAARYLRRAALPDEAIDLLAVIAALRGATEADLGGLAAEIGSSKPAVQQSLLKVAKCGLVDVDMISGRNTGRPIRLYEVRPPMLADVLVAERVFSTDVPSFSLESLLTRWPDRLFAITTSAINSALLGSPGARQVADHLFGEVCGGVSSSHGDFLQLSKRFARLDKDAAKLVLADTWTAFRRCLADGADIWAIERWCEMAYLIARWHLIESAVVLLLDAATVDQRETHSHPGHPLRKIDELVQSFHPDFPPLREHRLLVANVVDQWIQGTPSPDCWRVYGYAARSVLSLALNSTLQAPGDPRTVHMIRTIIGAEEMRRIFEDLWPVIRNRLTDAPPMTLKVIVDECRNWLRIGAGHDQPFGCSHPQSDIRTAKELGRKFILDLFPLVTQHPGLTSQLSTIAKGYGISAAPTVSGEDAPFFFDAERRRDWRSGIKTVEDRISEVVKKWATRDPAEAIDKLIYIRDELNLFGSPWPDRVELACRLLSGCVNDPLSWSDLALEKGLFPQAAPFLAAAIEKGEKLGNHRMSRYLSTPEARGAALEIVLVATQSDDWTLTLSRLEPTNYQLFETLILRGQLPTHRLRDLLTKTPAATRGAVAAAMIAEGRGEEKRWTPPEALREEWIEAILLFNPGDAPGFDDYEAKQLISLMTVQFPRELGSWLTSLLENCVRSDDAYEAIPHGIWEALHLLPHAIKDQLWTSFSNRPSIQWLLEQHLVGEDVEWLQHALDEGYMTPTETLDLYSSFGPHPTVEQLAVMLVPRGVDPREIAVKAELGIEWGEESERYTQLLDAFTGMAESSDNSVALVGRTGRQIYSAAREDALKRERQKRIRGEL